jgi:hypothetical protein
MIPGNLAPMIGPRNTIGRMIAGEKVPQAEILTDQSEFIRVYVDRDVQIPQQDAIGFIAQCAVCPQKAVLHLQPAGEWTCPRCTEIVTPPEPARSDTEASRHARKQDRVLPTVIQTHDGTCKYAPRQQGGGRHAQRQERYNEQRATKAAQSGAESARAFIDAEVRLSAQRAGFGDVDVAQAEPDEWPIGQVSW